MRDDAEESQPIEPLILKKERGVTFFLLQHEHEKAARIHMLRARYRRMHNRLLNNAIESDRRLGLDRGRCGHWRERLREHLVDLLAQRFHLHSTGREQRARLRLVGNCTQQMLETNRIVAAVGRKSECALDCLQRFGGERDWGFAHVCPIKTPWLPGLVPLSPAAGIRAARPAAGWTSPLFRLHRAYRCRPAPSR